MTEARKIAAPSINAENKPYFDAAAQGKLLIKRCAACGKRHFYPRAVCPFCFSERTEWLEAKGTGTIYTYSVMRVGAPYVIAYVTLDEGVTMMTSIVDCDFDKVRIGQRVKAIFVASEGGTQVPMFTPA
ncbi:MAG: Zn-ribbon domain-containing OB-fold protein [Clostridia bacterium]